MNSCTSPSTSRRFYNMEVVTNPTVQHDRIVFWQICQVLSKPGIGTKKSGLMHSVVLLTNPQWSVVRIETERVQGHSHDVTLNPTVISLKETHLPHGLLFQLSSILENGLWAGGLSLRSTRQPCFSHSESVLYMQSNRRAQDANSVFHQRCGDAVILYDNMLEATPGDTVALRIWSQLEPKTLNEREAKVFLISSLMRQVLKSPNK